MKRTKGRLSMHSCCIAQREHHTLFMPTWMQTARTHLCSAGSAVAWLGSLASPGHHAGPWSAPVGRPGAQRAGQTQPTCLRPIEASSSTPCLFVLQVEAVQPCTVYTIEQNPRHEACNIYSCQEPCACTCGSTNHSAAPRARAHTLEPNGYH